jgi:cell division septation protein DedD
MFVLRHDAMESCLGEQASARMKREMTGQKLWAAFLAAGVPDEDLKKLGEDLFWKRQMPTSAGSANSLLKIGGKLGIRGGILYDALNTGPGLGTLKQLASDYDDRRPWNAIAQSTRNYLEATGRRLPAEPVTPTPAKPTTRPATAKPATTTTKRVAARKPAPKKPTPPPAPSTEPGFFIPLAIGIFGILGLAFAWRT